MGKRTWREVGSKRVCDVSAGETYLSKSPGKVSNLEECKKTCEDASGCQSITYFKSGWCSHFGTACTKTKKNNKVVIALRLSTGASTSKPSVTTAPKRTWREVGSKRVCDVSAGETYCQNLREKSQTWKNAKRLVDMRQGVRASRTSRVDGVVILARRVPRPRRTARR